MPRAQNKTINEII